MESEFVRVSVEILIILVAAKLVGGLFERFGQAAVVGELLIGMILGPNVLGLIHPQESVVISYLAELGIIVLLFYVGIESELEHLLRSWRPALAVALIGVLVPLLLGAGYSLIAGHEPLLALSIGATLTATSITLGLRFAPFLFRLVQRMYVRGILIAAAFVYCLVLALLSLKIGLAVLIGAFAAGLMLEYAEERKRSKSPTRSSP